MKGLQLYADFLEGLEGSPLDADFLRYYNVNVLEIEEGVRLFGLIGNLPEDSETMIFYRGGPDFTFSESILTRIEHLIHSYMYAQRDKKAKAEKPVMILPEHIKKFMPEKEKELTEMTREEVEAKMQATREALKNKKQIPKFETGGEFN